MSRSFGGLLAVKSVDLTVTAGEIVGLIGPNGAGKTTLFNLISGLHRPTAGSVHFRGDDITRRTPDARCRLGIARTFQIVRPFPELTVLENVAVGSVYGRVPARSMRAAREASAQALDMVGLAEHARQQARHLTLVDRKRLELARALAAQPHLLLLDEWLAGLNPSEVEAALDLVRRIRESGITIILVEHIVKALFGVSDRILVLATGEKIAEGTPAQVAHDARVIAAYLGGAHADISEAALA